MTTSRAGTTHLSYMAGRTWRKRRASRGSRPGEPHEPHRDPGAYADGDALEDFGAWELHAVGG